MATPSSVPLRLTGDNVIDAAINGFYWQLDSDRTINWSMANGFSGELAIFPPYVKSTLVSVFNKISSYANVQFNYIGHYADPSKANLAGSDITVSVDGSSYLFSDPSAVALGFFPDASYNKLVYQGAPGDTFVNLKSLANFLPSYAPGSEGYTIVIHEIGHTLGLKHPFDEGGTGFPTFKKLGIPQFDKDVFTVMAYKDDYDFNLVFWDPATPMVRDVLALQYLYGKNNTTNATNTKYRLFENDRYQTIWDAGGTDAIDVSQASDGWAIQLPIIQLSTLVDTKVGSALPAWEASLPSPFTLYWLTGDIEHVIGSSFDDTLLGNDLSNSVVGKAGNDQLDGGAGNDMLDGGLGRDSVMGGLGDDQITMLVTPGHVDTIDAGSGNDTLLLSGVFPGNSVLVVDLSSTTDQVVSIGGVADALTQVHFEHLTASGIGGSVNVTGSAGDNHLIGSKGKDSLSGGAGNDTLRGGLGADLMTGGPGDDTIMGGMGSDNQQGGTGNDLFLIGSSLVFGVREIVDGGAGTDTLRYTGTTAATFTLTNLVIGMERVEIADAAGSLAGTTAINVNAAAVGNGLTIIGNNGANVLKGTSQADTLTGNGSNDRLRGGLGNDTYQVNRGDGRDRILERDSTMANNDTLLYGATINPLDLVLTRQVNDLRIAVHGTADSVTIQNWYTSSSNQVETIQAGNGQVLLNTQVDGLIQAMAQFTTDTGLSWDATSGGAGTPQQQAQFQGILAANWQS